VPTIDLLSEEQLLLAARVRELEERLERERARNAGLERGLDALSVRVTELREENARLRETRATRGT
jgi:chromosome segregation ATPase